MDTIKSLLQELKRLLKSHELLKAVYDHIVNGERISNSTASEIVKHIGADKKDEV